MGHVFILQKRRVCDSLYRMNFWYQFIISTSKFNNAASRVCVEAAICAATILVKILHYLYAPACIIFGITKLEDEIGTLIYSV